MGSRLCTPLVLLALAVTDAWQCATYQSSRSFAYLRRSSGAPLLAAKTTRKKKVAPKKGIKKPVGDLWAHTKVDTSSKSVQKKKSERLWSLIQSGKADAKQVKTLLSEGADVKKLDGDGYSLLHAACRGGMSKVATALIKGGADVDAACGGGGARPLHLAALAGHADAVSVLLANGAGIDLADEGAVGATAMHYAANAGTHSVIDVLIEAGASLDAMSGDGRSVLQFASFCADPAVAEKLLAAGAPALAKSKPWPRDRPPLEVLGVFDAYTEVQPQVTQVPLDAGSQFAEHTTLHFDQYDGDGGGTGGLTVHRFVVQGDDVRGTGREAGTLDATITRAAAAVKAEDPAGALRSNGGGYHSAASLRGRAEDPNDQCWGELHAILDEAATAAVQFEIGAGRAPHPSVASGGERLHAPLEVTDTWVNVNRGKGDFNKLHQHLPSIYSGVYYAQPPSNDGGRLNGAFVLPLKTTGDASPAGGSGDESTEPAAPSESEATGSEVTYAMMRPAVGTLMLFPAGMLHAVLPSWGKEDAEGNVAERISIGFNVSPFW